MIDRPPYKTIRSLDEIPAELDRVEVKIDGVWARIEIAGDTARIYSRHDTLLEECQLDDDFGRTTLLGELDAGDLIVFDCLTYDGVDISGSPLVARHHAAERVVRSLGAGFEMIEQYPAARARELWADLVVDQGAEGLVFKDSRSAYGAPWARLKRRLTVDYVCMGFEEAFGRRAGRGVGSIEAGLYVEGELVEIQRIGNMTDTEASAMYAAPELYVGRVFTAAGQEQDEYTGCLRHGSFVEWHKDKRPEECTATLRSWEE